MMLSEVLNDSRISRLIELALLEDIGMGDLTSEAVVPDSHLGEAGIICKEGGVVAGLEVAALVFQYSDHSITLTPLVLEGSRVSGEQVIARVDGKARSILQAERTALNFLQRMSGIATLTREFVDQVGGTRAKITDTRKTAPGLRVLDKWAVRLGGGVNHRFGLDDMVLIKENHVHAAGGIIGAVESCKRYLREKGITASIEVETRNLEEVKDALRCREIQRIMLDNFSTDELKKAVTLIDHVVEVEASGGVTLRNVREIAETGVDFISVGALTHSVRAVDISLELTHSNR